MLRKSILLTLCAQWAILLLGAYANARGVDTGLRHHGADAHRYLLWAEPGLIILALVAALVGREQRRGAAAALSVAILMAAAQVALPLLLAADNAASAAYAFGRFGAYLVLSFLYRAWLAASGPIDAEEGVAAPWLRRTAVLALLLLILQVAQGTWVVGSGSGAACPDMPTCLGHWWPDVDYAMPHAVWQYMGGGAHPVFDLAQRVAVHWVHRVGGVALVLVLTVFGFSLTAPRLGRRLNRTGLLINLLVLAQLASGILAVKFHLPMVATVAHTLLAAGLWLCLVRAHHYLGLAEEAPAAAPPAEVISEVLAREAAVPVAPAPVPVTRAPVAPVSMLQRLRGGLRKTRGGLSSLLSALPLGRKIDDSLLEDIETTLLMADVGVDATQELVKALVTTGSDGKPPAADDLRQSMKAQMLSMLKPCEKPLTLDGAQKPFVILVVGVNGVGKTTTIGKLARRLQDQGRSVMLAAGDTFRAAAVEQLQVWGERNGIPVVAQHTGADSASVLFDALQSAQAKGVDVLIADTAGRLHTKSNLMEELKKIKRILAKLDDSAPHEVLLVLDAGTGQNAISQARQFHDAVELTGIALTKLDGTAKGGVIFALARQFGVPIRYIGVGESIEDLQDFQAEAFVDALLEQDAS